MAIYVLTQQAFDQIQQRQELPETVLAAIHPLIGKESRRESLLRKALKQVIGEDAYKPEYGSVVVKYAKPYYRAVKVRLNTLSPQDRELLTYLGHQAALLYNEALKIAKPYYLTHQKAEKAHLRTVSEWDLDSQCRNGDTTQEYYQILGSKMASYTVHVAAGSVKSYDALLYQYLEKYGFSTFKELKAAVKARPGYYKKRPRLPRWEADEKDIGFAPLIVQRGNGYTIKMLDSGESIIQLSLSPAMRKQGYRPVCLHCPTHIDPGSIKEVKILVKHRGTRIEAVIAHEVETDFRACNTERALSVDIGVNNLATCVDFFDEYTFILDGRWLKATNQWYNKERKRLQQIQRRQLNIPQYQVSEKALERLQKRLAPETLEKVQACAGQEFYTDKEMMSCLHLSEAEAETYREVLLQQCTNRQKIPETTRMFRLREKRNVRVKDYAFKAAKRLIGYCLDHNLGTLIVGYNMGWKQGIKRGRRFNQNFAQIPFKKFFLSALANRAELFGIAYKEIQESHTSKCSFLDTETIEHHDGYVGTRIKRGLFRTASGPVINADCNGAANIAIRGGVVLPKPREAYRAMLAAPEKISLFEKT